MLPHASMPRGGASLLRWEEEKKPLLRTLRAAYGGLRFYAQAPVAANTRNLERPVPMRYTKSALVGALLTAGAATPAFANDLSANAAVTNNYVWRGLTQTLNEAAVQGGIDYADDSGFYIGTWVSNVQYGAEDVYSYEHDIYLGFSGGDDTFSWDVGYLYYNYDEAAEFDFGEIYGTVGFGGFSFSANLLTNTEADEGPTQDFGMFEAYYLSADYGFVVGNDIEIGLHVGYHDGDFMEAFNGADGDYYDYNVSLSKGGFAFMISGTNVDGDAATGFTPNEELDNDEIRFVVSYSVDVDLLN